MSISVRRARPISLARAIFVCVLTASLSLAGITAWSLWRSRSHALANAETVATNLAAVIDRHSLTLTNSLLFGLGMIDESYRDPRQGELRASGLGPASSAASPNTSSIDNSLVRAVVVWNDRDRTVSYQHVTSASIQPISAQQIGTVVFDRSIGDIQVGSPLLDKAEQRWLVPFVKQQPAGPKGAAQWIFLFVDLDQIEDIFSGLDIGRRGSFVVLRPDGQVVALSPYDAGRIGTFPATAATLRENWTDRASGILHGASILDGTKQIIGFKRIDSSHTVAVVSLSEADVLAQWSDELWTDAAVVALCVGVLFGLGTLTGNAARQHERAENNLKVTLEQLGQAKEAAESANSAKTRFLTSMSHEIRTPLNAILGLPLLARARLNGDRELARHLDLIEKSGQALLTVINDVLDLAKIEAGRVELDQRPLVIRGLVDDALAIVRGLAEQRGLSLSRSIDDAFPARIVGDEARLRQVLLNLLNNAVKFTSTGGIDLDVALSPGGETFSIAVRDTGMGIQSSHIERLFEDFQQLDSSGSRQFGGTGLGLSISRRLVELMGGTIGVESRHGVGSTFTIRLPLISSPVEDASRDGACQGRVDRPARTILVVDDVEVNREIVAHMLRTAGHRVETADTGPRAIDAYRIRRHDLILMDVQMPHMDGLDATRRIRALDEAGRSVPIIALTANVFAQQIKEYQAAGLNDHIGKPIQSSRLLSVIERWTGGSAESAPGEGKAGEPGPLDVDRDGQARLRQRLGPDRFGRLLRSFRADLEGRLAVRDGETLKRDAHAMMSAADFLGFTGFAAIARESEQLLLRGAAPETVCDRLVAARAAALLQMDDRPGEAGSAERADGPRA